MKQTILIATEKENDLLELVLSTENHDLVFCTTGREVLSHLREDKPALLIVDAHLPDLSGISITSRVRRVSRLAGLPILLIVSARATNTLLDAQNAGADEIVTKPLTGKDIRSLVSRLLGGTVLGDAAASLRDGT